MGNTVNRLGEECKKEEPCYFLHSDMLHESPACIGIAHDPETYTAYGNVYWTFDTHIGQLIRFDFQQPHGPGSMDHSIASVRRYVEIDLERGSSNVHAGMAVHDIRRELYVSVPGADKIIVVAADSGSFARTAREEFPIYSNPLPSFEYSIWECVDWKDFASGIKTPSGLAILNDRLFVAERKTGKILVYDVLTGSLLSSFKTGLSSIGGLSFSTSSEVLHFVDTDTNSLYRLHSDLKCTSPVPSRFNPEFEEMVSEGKAALGDSFSLMRDYDCVVDPIIPNVTFFEQVHNDTGYANLDTQDGGMNAEAVFLANRTDCGFDSELNFDSLLLGGYLCHVCLPEMDKTCDVGGTCTNIQWRGYTCDNEFYIVQDDKNQFHLQYANETKVDLNVIVLEQGISYRFNVLVDVEVCMLPLKIETDWFVEDYIECAKNGPLLLPSTHYGTELLLFFVDGYVVMGLELALTSPVKVPETRRLRQRSPHSK